MTNWCFTFLVSVTSRINKSRWTFYTFVAFINISSIINQLILKWYYQPFTFSAESFNHILKYVTFENCFLMSVAGALKRVNVCVECLIRAHNYLLWEYTPQAAKWEWYLYKGKISLAADGHQFRWLFRFSTSSFIFFPIWQLLLTIFHQSALFLGRRFELRFIFD